jgi:hypothetical protein
VIATAVGPLFAPNATVLPETEFTLPCARTLGGAGGADVSAVDDTSEVGDVDGSDEVELSQPARRRTVADTAASRAGRRALRKEFE